MNRPRITTWLMVVVFTAGLGTTAAAARQSQMPRPDSHQSYDWWQTHDDSARTKITFCAVCHTQSGCQSCHSGELPDLILQLPPGDGPGLITRRPPPTHTMFWADTHRESAAAGRTQCQVCHVQDQCSSCHTGSEAVTSPSRDVAGYHPSNFMQQHSAPAFGRDVECASCHNPEAFCRDCHAGLNMSTVGRQDTGFHNRKPLFEFGHGQAARQALESCVTCHAQSDCLVCHSAISGRGVNPHGREFDPRSMRTKAPATCLRCHTSAILNR